MTDYVKLHLLRLFVRTVAAQSCRCDDETDTGELCLSCTAALLLRTINEKDEAPPVEAAQG